MTTLDRLILLVVAIVLLVISAFVAMTLFGSSALIDWLLIVQSGKFDGILLIVILLLLVGYLALMLANERKADERAVVQQTLGRTDHCSTISGWLIKLWGIEGIKELSITVTG